MGVANRILFETYGRTPSTKRENHTKPMQFPMLSSKLTCVNVLQVFSLGLRFGFGLQFSRVVAVSIFKVQGWLSASRNSIPQMMAIPTSKPYAPGAPCVDF